MNHELPDVQAGFRKRQRNQRSYCQHPLDHQKSKRVPEKHLFLLYWLCQSLWLCGSQETVENSERDGNTRPSDLPPAKSVCSSGSQLQLYMEQQTGSKSEKECQGRILSPWFFNLYAGYIIQNPRLDEAQAGIKIARRNINNLRYADDTSLMAESEERKSLLIKVRGEWKSWLKTQRSEN